MATFRDRLEEALRMRDLTPAELSRISGVNEGAISQYRSGAYKASQRSLDKLSKALNVSVAWLMGADVAPSISIPTSINILPMPKTYKVPLVGTIACGQPILAVDEVDDTVDVPEWVDADFALRCKGDSMINARIFDGDIVYIKRQPEVENGQIAAVRIEDEATLKKVYYSPDSGRITLRACNPLYDDMVYEGEVLNQIEVLGLAVGFYSEIRHGH